MYLVECTVVNEVNVYYRAALHWALDSGYVQSLRQSLDAFPSQLRPLSSVADAIQPAANGTLGDDDHDVNSDGDLDPLDSKPPASVAGCAAFLNSKGPVKWRTDLLATQPYWQAWYTGLSQVFLGEITQRSTVETARVGLTVLWYRLTGTKAPHRGRPESARYTSYNRSDERFV